MYQICKKAGIGNMKGLITGFLMLIFCLGVDAQTIYTVNSTNDIDDGACDGIHCSLREAIRLSNADNVNSEIHFNIPGPGIHTEIPNGPLPTITAPNLFIKGDTQNGGLLGSYVINLQNRNFGGNSYLKIEASNVTISGIMFQSMAYTSIDDHIIHIEGSSTLTDCFILNCAFIGEFNLGGVSSPSAVLVGNVNGFVFGNNIYGSDYQKTNASQCLSHLHFKPQSNSNIAVISQNIFANEDVAIVTDDGDFLIENNIFNGLDTFGAIFGRTNSKAIVHANGCKTKIRNNFFFGTVDGSIHLISAGNALVENNKFLKSNIAVNMNGGIFSDYTINNNRAYDGDIFVDANITGSKIRIDSNIVERFNKFYETNLFPPISQSSFIANTINCINTKVVNNVNQGAVYPIPPTITAINRDAIYGTALPNHNVVVYTNAKKTCPNAVCQGGTQLGVALSDNAGNWVLNTTYPNRTNISAYQYTANSSAPQLYSEFSQCYTCPGIVQLKLNPFLCSGQTFPFRNKIYDAVNNYDSLVIPGDNLSICDSVIVIKLDCGSGTRSTQNVNFCYNQSTSIGGITIDKNNPVDSFTVTASNGCDSTIVLFGTERGFFQLNRTICSNDFITVGTTRFDINNPQGIVVLANQSVFGCDSTVQVSLTIKDYSESDFVKTICETQTITVGNQTFDKNNLSGKVTLPGQSYTGCDSVVNVNLTLANTKAIKVQSLCKGDSVFIIDRFFSDRNPTGQIMLTSYLGCDSTLDVRIDILPTALGFYRADICRGDTLRFPDHPGQFFTSGRTTGTLRNVNGSVNGCDSLTEVDLTVLPDAIGSFDKKICANDSVDIYGQVYSIQKPRGTQKLPIKSYRNCDTFLTVNLTFNPISTGSFRDTICSSKNIVIGNRTFDINNPSGSILLPSSNSNGCDSTLQVDISFYSPITLSYNKMDLECNFPNTGEFVLNSLTGGSGIYKIKIDNQAAINFTGTFTAQQLSLGIHQIQIQDIEGCDTSFQFQIDGANLGVIRLPNDTTIKEGNSVIIQSVIPFNPSTISWDPTTSLSCDDCANPVATPSNTTTYTLTVTDENGCIFSDVMTITVLLDQSEIYVPTIFSPNGDQLNEKFYPVFKFPLKTRILNFAVFDRWGEQMFAVENLGYNANGDIYGWDGTFRGTKLNPGVYAYYIIYQADNEGKKIKTGDVTLIK